MHIKVAICDDDINIQFSVEKHLQKIFDELDISAEIECFDCGDDLCLHYNKGEFDLIFLDIEFKGRNGVEIGCYIRESLKDEIVQIAYISGKTNYALELFEYHPINFLIKPFNENDIKRVIEKYLILSNQKIEIFQYKIGGNIYQTALSEILYFSSCARKITLHKNYTSAEFYGTLDSIYNQIKGKQFLYTHKSFIVNCQWIKKMEYEQLILYDGTIIPISQSRRSAIRKQFLNIKKGVPL